MQKVHVTAVIPLHNPFFFFYFSEEMSSSHSFHPAEGVRHEGLSTIRLNSVTTH